MFGWASFGRVKFKDEIYEHDIWVDTEGNAHKREVPDKHIIDAEELRNYLTDDTEAVVIGSGMMGCVKISDDALELIDGKKLELHKYESPQAVKEYNTIILTRKTIAIIHVTC
jgi:hypothetical protein